MECNATDLAHAVDAVCKIKTGKSVTPVLDGVKISPHQVTRTNLAEWVRVPLDSSGAPLETVVPAKLLRDCLKRLSGTITLSATPDALQLTDGRRTYNVNAWPVSDFPEGIGSVWECVVSLPRSEWDAAWQRVRASARKGDDRPILCGVLFLLDAQGLTVVSTDSYRLVSVLVSRSLTGDESLIVPARALELAGKYRGDFSLWVNADHTRARIAIGDISVETNLIEGHYPNYKQLIRTSSDIQAVVDRVTLLGAIDAVAPMAQRNAPVRLTLNGSLRVWALTQDVGTAEEVIPCAADGELEIGFNPDYLTEGLKIFEDDTVTLGLASPLFPLIVEEDDTTFLLMPVRLSS